MAIRAASIWRAVMRPGSSTCRPKSPKSTSAARYDRPRFLPFCCFRNLVRLGESIEKLQRSASLRGRSLLASALWNDLTLEDPALHADRSIGGEGGGFAELDVRAQRVQRDP